MVDKNPTMVDKDHTMVDKNSIEGNLQHIPDSIAKLITTLGRRSHNTDLMRRTIGEVCGWRDFSIAELSELLNRNEKYIKTNYIQPLIDEGRITYTIPAMLTHPNQKYRTVKS